MINWAHKLGKHLLNEGALSYIISDEDPTSWDGEEELKQKVDMVAFYEDHVDVIELKETEAMHRKGIKYKQIERYNLLCNNAKYQIDFWVYVYWREYNTITGVKMDRIENLQFYAIDKDDGVAYYASIGVDPETRIRKVVDFKMELM